MNIIVIVVLAAALALIVAAFCAWSYRVGHEAGRRAGYSDGLETGREQATAGSYGRGYQDATEEINARRDAEDGAAFKRGRDSGYLQCLEEIRREVERDEVPLSGWWPLRQPAGTA